MARYFPMGTGLAGTKSVSSLQWKFVISGSKDVLSGCIFYFYSLSYYGIWMPIIDKHITNRLSKFCLFCPWRVTAQAISQHWGDSFPRRGTRDKSLPLLKPSGLHHLMNLWSPIQLGVYNSMYCWRPVTVLYSWHYWGYFFLRNKTIFVSWKGNVLSVAISSQQLLLARAKGDKKRWISLQQYWEEQFIIHSAFSGSEGPFESHYRMTTLLYDIKQLH